MSVKHEAKTDREYLRQVVFDDYCLRIWNSSRTNRRDLWGRNCLAYELLNPDGDVLFEGDDFSPPQSFCLDSDRVLRELLGFLTLKPGDTDDDYFKEYTPMQLAFADGDADMLNLWTHDDLDKPRKNFAGGPDIPGEGSYQFTNIDGWVHPDREDFDDE